MKSRLVRSGFRLLLPCAAACTLGALTAFAEPPERVGGDAPHQERNAAKNEKKSAISLSSLTVPETGKPVRKATAVSSEKPDKKDRKKAAREAKEAARAAKERERQQAEATAAENARQRPQYNTPADDFVGSDAPRQERSSDPNRHAARLFIWERP